MEQEEGEADFNDQNESVSDGSDQDSFYDTDGDGDTDDDDDDDNDMLCALGGETVLLRLHRNDPIISGLYVDQGYWIKGAGQAIGKSQVLKLIRILISSDAASGGTAWIQELCRGLVRNRSLEKFELNLKFTEHIDIFQQRTKIFATLNYFNLHRVLFSRFQGCYCQNAKGLKASRYQK